MVLTCLLCQVFFPNTLGHARTHFFEFTHDTNSTATTSYTAPRLLNYTHVLTHGTGMFSHVEVTIFSFS